MIYSNTLEKSFESKKEMFKELVANKQNILKLKCAQAIKSDLISLKIHNKDNSTDKAEVTKAAPLEYGDTIQCVISTMLYMDSHDDVHALDMFRKSVNEQQGRVYHAVEHRISFDRLVAFPQDVQMELRDMSWASLGKEYYGETQVLIFHSKITDSTNEYVFKAYRDNRPVQHSISMRYVNIVLAINDPEMKEEYAEWIKYRPLIANGERADEQGYFFWVKEAKIAGEGSTVIRGSNDATPYMGIETTSLKQPDTQSTVEDKSENTQSNEDVLSEISKALDKFLNK